MAAVSHDYGEGRRKGLSLQCDSGIKKSWSRPGLRLCQLPAMFHFQEKKWACWKKQTDSESILGIHQFLGNSIWANIIESATLDSLTN
jgi:hypothetical protein